jgi:hypothetical protein
VSLCSNDHRAAAVCYPGDTPGKVADFSRAGQLRLNAKLRSRGETGGRGIVLPPDTAAILLDAMPS